MKMLVRLLMGAVCGIAPASQVYAQEKTITIATEGAYEPWNFTKDGELAGFDVDLANDLCERMKLKCQIVAQDWDGLIPALNAGKFDAIMASMFITPKREEAIAFSRPYAIGAVTFMTAKDGPLAGVPGTGELLDLDKAEEAKKLLDEMRPAMKGTIFGVQSATANAFFFDKYFKGDVEIREYKTTEQHDLDLQAGRIDAISAQVTSIAAALKKPGFENFVMVGPSIKGEMFGKGVGAGLRKQDTELKAAFDKAIGEALADGTITRLSEKWFEFDMAKLF